MGRVAVVTGANKGIGYAIVKNLALSDKSLTVVLTARSEARGRQAVSSLNLPNVLFHPLDVTSTTSVSSLKDWIEKRYGAVDILINNAGYRYKGEEFNEEIAKESVDVNFWGIVNMWKAMQGLLKDGESRVVNVSSRSGDLKKITNDNLKGRFVAKDLTVKAVEELMRQFVSDVREGKAKENGWPTNAYAVSKLGATALTRAIANEAKDRGISVFACCPGLVKTDVTFPAFLHFYPFCKRLLLVMTADALFFLHMSYSHVS